MHIGSSPEEAALAGEEMGRSGHHRSHRSVAYKRLLRALHRGDISTSPRTTWDVATRKKATVIAVSTLPGRWQRKLKAIMSNNKIKLSGDIGFWGIGDDEVGTGAP